MTMTTAARKRGRPSKLTDDVRAALCEGHAAGLTIADSCSAAGIDDTTLRKWRQRADDGDESYIALFADITRARKAGIRARLDRVIAAATKGAEVVEVVKTEKQVLVNGRPVTLVDQSTTMRTMPPDWRAGAWWLEHVEGEQYARSRHEHTGKDGGPIHVFSYADAVSVFAAGSVGDSSVDGEG